MGELGGLIQQHMDHQRYRVSNAQIASAVGVSRQTVSNWIRGEAMPTPENLRALSRVIETPYSRVLDAALVDNGYLPGAGGGEGRVRTESEERPVNRAPQETATRQQAPQGHPR